MYLDSAMRVTQWRQSVNNFYMTVNAAFFPFLAITINKLTNGSKWGEHFLVLIMISAAVMIYLNFFWLRQIFYYRALNAAKFSVISAFENHDTGSFFSDEWRQLESDHKISQLTLLEQSSPFLFILMHVLLFFWALFSFQ